MTDKELLQIHYYLRLTRALEDRLRILYRQGKIVGGLFLSRGQEAIAVGFTLALRPEDVIAFSHRDMGAVLIRGIPPAAIFAQHLGRAAGLSRGKDGTIHFTDLSRGLIGPISMLADLMPVAAGVALAMKIRKENRVALTCFGEGASNRGDFHESLNFAAVLRLPAIFVCNNNRYAYATPVEKSMTVENVADRASGYGMPGIVVDGNDVLAVHRAVAEAADRARAGGGPTLIECKTMRMTGHAEHDDAWYIPREEFQAWEKKDPLLRFEAFLKEKGLLTADDKVQLEARIKEEIDRAVAKAEGSPYPAPEEAAQGLFA